MRSRAHVPARGGRSTRNRNQDSRCGVALVLGALLVANVGAAAPSSSKAPAATSEVEEPDEKSGDSDEVALSSDAVEDEAVEGTEADVPAARAARSELGLRALEDALARRKLAPTATLSTARLRAELADAENKLREGRLAEAVATSAAIVESSRFEPFRESPEGRSLRLVLGDALGRSGAYAPARAVLVPLIEGSSANDAPGRGAIRVLVDQGLESGQPQDFAGVLEPIEANLPDDLKGDVAYLRGRAFEKAGKLDDALRALRDVGPQSRFWAQAVYLSGVLEAEQGDLKKAEEQFCRVADPKLTPKEAPLFGGSDFFEMRDLARLGLGRVAHESYRFDDAQYYYYLVPRDSSHLPEALYEAATTRYEAKDYDGAREYMDKLVALERSHIYEDERYVLDAYIDLASCKFGVAENKLDAFLAKYEPVRNAAGRLRRDPEAVGRLVAAIERGADPASASLGVPDDVARKLGTLLRADGESLTTSRRLAVLRRQMDSLASIEAELRAARVALSSKSGKASPTALPQTSLVGSESDQLDRIEAQVSEIARLLREAEASGKVPAEQVAALRSELEAMRLRARQVRLGESAAAGASTKESADLVARIEADEVGAQSLRNEALAMRAALEKRREEQAEAALGRLEMRLSRLIRRARLGRIEIVLGKKRSLEIEIEALSEGLLPPSMVDSLDVARYLGDDEEYWPDDGEDWEDEYVGGEGL